MDLNFEQMIDYFCKQHTDLLREDCIVLTGMVFAFTSKHSHLGPDEYSVINDFFDGYLRSKGNTLHVLEHDFNVQASIQKH